MVQEYTVITKQRLGEHIRAAAGTHSRSVEDFLSRQTVK
jgi:hypothetical protein